MSKFVAFVCAGVRNKIVAFIIFCDFFKTQQIPTCNNIFDRWSPNSALTPKTIQRVHENEPKDSWYSVTDKTLSENPIYQFAPNGDIFILFKPSKL